MSNDKSKTPVICFFGKHGLTRGPRILKKVLSFRLFLIGATCFIAGWNNGACSIQIPAVSIDFVKKSALLENLIPKNSNTLLEPQDDDTP